jgi:hypothetical protein
MIKVYNGLLVATSNGEEDDLLGLMDEDSEHHWSTDILAELIEQDMYDGEFLSVKYFISDVKMDKDTLLDSWMKTLYGEGEAEYSTHYSEITGYLWTDEEINVGGHDLLEELRSNMGKWLYMEIDYSKEPNKS